MNSPQSARGDRTVASAGHVQGDRGPVPPGAGSPTFSAGHVLNGEPSGMTGPVVSTPSGTAGSTTPDLRDPVAIVARELCRDSDHGQVEWTGFPCSDCAEWARRLVGAVADRWRIVRTSPRRTHGLVDYDEIAEEWRP
jgi:hypothetical protein